MIAEQCGVSEGEVEQAPSRMIQKLNDRRFVSSFV